MSRSRPIRAFAGHALVGLLTGLLPISSLSANQLDQHLRDKYQGKTLILRGFYSGSSLRYDPAGTPADTMHGDWTLDGVVQIEDVRVSGDHLKIRATRLHLGWAVGGLQNLHDYVARDKLDKDEKKDRGLRIEAALGGAATTESVDGALSRIFLTPQDSFADLVPDYWKECVRLALTAETEKNPPCHFSPEFLAIPGVAAHSNSDANADSATASSEKATSRGVFKVSGGISPPKTLNAADPEFSEAARRSKFQGVVTLKLVVDTSGTPTNIRIFAPRGCGLDAQAVRAVETWRFKPSEKDGQPVPVEIAVEIEFHLY